MINISRESEINLINILIDQDIISGKDLINIKKVSTEGQKSQLDAVFELNLTDENKILDFVSIGPNAATGGTVEIGKNSVIGIGSNVKHNVKIGKNCIIGAGSYVNKNTKENSIYYGLPAKYIRHHSFGDEYL